jgi:hypothetical protein
MQRRRPDKKEKAVLLEAKDAVLLEWTASASSPHVKQLSKADPMSWRRAVGVERATC